MSRRKRRAERILPNRHTVKLCAEVKQQNADLAARVYLTRARQRAVIRRGYSTPAGAQLEAPEAQATHGDEEQPTDPHGPEILTDVGTR